LLGRSSSPSAIPSRQDKLNNRIHGTLNIDQPLFAKSIKPRAFTTSAVGYVRLHGRNYKNWFTENQQSKNSLFYKTRNGARMGDLFMSLIHTCELNGANPFDYLTELQRHADEVKSNPADWMPWNYRETLLRLTASPAA
jgi:hypothetical protein